MKLNTIQTEFVKCHFTQSARGANKMFTIIIKTPIRFFQFTNLRYI